MMMVVQEDVPLLDTSSKEKLFRRDTTRIQDTALFGLFV